MSSQLPLFKSQWSWVKESLSSNILWALPENCRRSTDPPKRATGVLRHGFIAGICSPAALIFQEFSCSFHWLLQAHWGNSQEKPRDINISYYLILNPTAFCSSHYGFTHFLGWKLEESLPWINLFVIMFMSPVMCRGSVSDCAVMPLWLRKDPVRTVAWWAQVLVCCMLSGLAIICWSTPSHSCGGGDWISSIWGLGGYELANDCLTAERNTMIVNMADSIKGPAQAVKCLEENTASKQEIFID